MLTVNLIFITTLFVILYRYLLVWIWGFIAPDIEVLIVMVSLATALRFGENKGEKLKEILNKLRDKFGKKKS